MLAALRADLGVPNLLLTNRADRALGLFDELNFWLGRNANFYFPDPNPHITMKPCHGRNRPGANVLNVFSRS